MRFSPIIIPFLLVLTLACNNKVADESKETSTKQNIKIKVCRIYQSDFVLVDPNEKGQLIQEFRFNKEGYVNELIRYGIDGKEIGRFDIYGKNTPFPMPNKPEFMDTVLTLIDFDTSGVIAGKEVKIFNDKGLLIQVDFFEGEDSMVRRNTYKYHSNNMIKEDIYWDVELDKPKQKIIYEFEY